MDDYRDSGQFDAERSSCPGQGFPHADAAGRPGVIPFESPADLDNSGGVGGPAGLLVEAAETICSAEASGLSRDDLEQGIRALTRVRSAVDACEARFAAEINRLDDFGDRSEAVLRRLSGCSAATAKRAAGRAAALAEMPNVEAALSEGHITGEHADVLTNAAGLAGTDAVNDASRLLEVASSTNVERTRRAANDWVRELRKGLTPDEEYRRQRALRGLSITQTAEGLIKATALMDPATGAAFKAIIEDVAQRFAEADRHDARPDAPEPRTYTQCRADALSALVGTDNRRAARRWYAEVDLRDAASIAERNGWTPPAPLPPLAPDHLTGLTAGSGTVALVESEPLPIANGAVPKATSQLSCDASLRRRNQLVIVADTRAVLGDKWADCEIPGTGPIPTHVLERLACGADIFGLVFDGRGQPLWHGRRVRTVTDPQWRALLARDRHCVICAAAPTWCEAHHIIPWQAPARGRTDIDNLALLCSRCHHQLHDSGGQLQRTSPTSFTVAFGRQRE
ncbi:HNH endonuclease [Candidatus Poriferisodalis sp.]|uniref:HNH endonuclease signature motif containing protein n=1 Tax=Candidatus Poriferisodalis sp. TaxID=3101277 RepID=UPI003C6F5E55